MNTDFIGFILDLLALLFLVALLLWGEWIVAWLV